MADQSERRPKRAALFVDFDNIFIGLRRSVGEEVADAFATDPVSWLRWFERGLPNRGATQSSEVERSILVRRCYLNPKPYARYRPFFTRGAFRVVDCPSLTARDKNSADIQMVMDILDTMNHSTYFDEFIIMSGDADFTPVLLRLRAHDRRTIVLTTGPTAEAYLAACDRVITEEVFVEHGLSSASRRPVRPEWEVTGDAKVAEDDVLQRIANRVYEEASKEGEIDAIVLPRIYQQFPEFTPESQWLGYHSLRKLSAKLVSLHPALRLIEDDPSWKIGTVPTTATTTTPVDDDVDLSSNLEALRDRIIAVAAEIVSGAKGAVVLSSAAEAISKELGEVVLETRWAGAGSFKELLESTPGLPFQFNIPPNTPGFLFDAHRHGGEPETQVPDPFEDKYPELAALTRRVHLITAAPRLTPEEYEAVFDSISIVMTRQPELRASSDISRVAREVCLEQGHSVSLRDFNRIMRAIAYARDIFEPGDSADTPHGLATSFLRGLVMLCDDAQLELSPEDGKLLTRWIMGQQAADALNN
jgi:hypothetical protein